VGDRLRAEDREDTGDVSTVTVAVTNRTETLPAHVAQGNAGNNATGLPPLGESANQVITLHFYHRLSHTLSHLLKELPVVVGTNVILLCDLLLKVLKVRQMSQMTEQTIYEIMYSYYLGELLAPVTNSITDMESFEFFHVRLLRQFIPSKQISQLRTEKYERVQYEGESLATYVQSVRDAALVLRISENEAQVVQRIVEGLTQTQRARFVFQAPLPSFCNWSNWR
jgi:hypothetical protein